MEPKYPGLVERYVNLGDCYDRAGLQPLRQELMGCMKGYKACYQRAYRCLTAAAQIGEDMRAMVATPAVDAKSTSDSFTAPTPEWMTFTRTSSLDSFSRLALTASAEP